MLRRESSYMMRASIELQFNFSKEKSTRALANMTKSKAVCGYDRSGHLVAACPRNRHTDGATWSCGSYAGQRRRHTVFFPRHPGKASSPDLSTQFACLLYALMLLVLWLWKLFSPP